MMFGMGLGLIGIVIFAVLVVALIAGGGQLLRRGQFSGPARSSGDESSAKELLDQRYARGELSREDYETIKRDLVN